MDKITEKMRDEWDERAVTRASAMRSILDGWTGSEKAFFDRGKDHVADMMGALAERDIYISKNSVGVEIGAGIGRCSMHLAGLFSRLYATDISQAMIDKCPKIENVIYIATGTLADVPEKADYIVSHLVLQHIPKPHFWKYIDESYALLNVGGILITQLHETDEPTEQGDNTLLVRGYTKDELRDGINAEQWEIVSLLEPAGISEVWKWLVLRKHE